MCSDTSEWTLRIIATLDMVSIQSCDSIPTKRHSLVLFVIPIAFVNFSSVAALYRFASLKMNTKWQVSAPVDLETEQTI